jgi:3-hydroxyacyl-[acyl-carrier-protein] dehydratase
MLSGNFFTIQTVAVDAGSIQATLQMNASHPIFEGHFPGQPVVPGVCMLQMIKEIVELVIKAETRIVSAAEIKFLAVVHPVENNKVQAQIKYSNTETSSILVVASLMSGVVTHFKCRCELIVG